MRILRIGFIAVVAILIIGVTMASQAGFFEGKKVIAIADCFIPSGTDLAVKDLTCPASPNTILAGDACLEAASNYAVFDLDPSQFLLDQQIEIICDDGQFFCCFKIKVGTLCSNPLINAGDGIARRYQVSHVFCKVTEN